MPLYEHQSIPGVTQPGTIQWLNPNAFVSTVDPSTGACAGGDSAQNCQFGNLGRNALRGPDFVWSDFYLTKWFKISERIKLRIEGQLFNVFNHPNFAPAQRTDTQAFPASLPRRLDLALSPGPLLRPPVCWASDSAAIARLE